MEPSIATVIITGLVLVFAILILLFLIIALQGVIFVGLDKKSAKKQDEKPAAAPAPAAKAAPAPAPAPAVQAGIPGEVVAAISAAVTAMSDTPVAVRSITKAPARRNGWALAGVYSYTEPF